ncbi:MAG: hypothetical protein SGPRY_009611 [Prymnesium sp.]
METHPSSAEVHAASGALIKSLAWGKRTPPELQRLGAVNLLVSSMQAFPRNAKVLDECSKALENLCLNQVMLCSPDESSEICRREACEAGLLTFLLRTMNGKMEQLVPYNLVHELYQTDHAHQSVNSLSLSELRKLQAIILAS